MPFSSIFHQRERCQENRCKVNKRKIKKIYKPDDGFLNENLKKQLFGVSEYKICDCIIICDDDNIVIIEILCGTLTYREYKEKIIQLQNCFKVIESQALSHKIKQIVLQYQRLEKEKHNPQFRKKLISPRISKIKLDLIKEQTITINC